MKPRLTEKVMNGLGRLAGYADSGDPADILGVNPEPGSKAEQDWAEIEAAIAWVRAMVAHRKERK